MMKRRFVFLVFMVSLCVSMSYAQTESYRNLVREWLETGVGGNSVTPDMLKSIYVVTNKTLIDSIDITKNLAEEKKQKLAEDIAAKYVKEQMTADLADIFASMWKDQVTEEQLKEIVEMTRTERAKTAIAHLNGMMGNMQQDVVNMIVPMITSIMLGTESEPVKPVECSESYKQAFRNYYEQSGSDKLLETLENTIQSSGSQDNAEMQKAFKSVMDYMRDNMEVWMRNMMVGKVTEDDLKYWTEMTTLPGYQGMMSSLQEKVVADPMSFATLLVEKYGEWIEANVDSLFRF